MKRLTIMRHAKSSWDDPSIDDFDRPLNERGREAALRVGREMKTREMAFDQVIASPATRVRETLEGLARGYEHDLPVRLAPAIYGASAGALQDVVRALPEDVEAPLLVGHNPGLQNLIVALAHGDDDELLARVRSKFPTAAVAVIELPAAAWREVEPHSGEVVDLILPRELA